MAMLALCDGQLSTQDEIEVLSETDEQLVKKVQETREFINGQLIDAIQVLNGKTDQNRRQIWQLAEMMQKSLQKLTQKVNQQSHELGRAEDLSEVELPLLGAAVAEGEAIEDHKIQELAHLTKMMQIQQEMDLKVEKMLNHSNHRVQDEIARLKDEVNKTKRLERLSDPNKELQAFQREAVGDEAKKIEAVQSELSQLMANTDNKMHQLEEAQRLKSQKNEAEIKFLDDRMSENHKSLILQMQIGYKWILFQELLFFLFLGMTGMAAHQLLRMRRSMQTSGLQQPLLHDTANSEDSFSVVSVQPVARQPQLFLKRTAMSLQEGPPVAAEDLRPNCSVHGAMGGWLEVESVTFKHVQQCDVVQLTLATDAPSLCITARQRVVRASTAKEVIPAMELREGDLMLYRGSCIEVQKCERQTLHNAELVEVVFDSEGAVETLADAETEQFNFHIV